MKGAELWELISCMQHSGPLYLPYERRVPVEVLGRMAGLLLSHREDRESDAYRARLDHALRHLFEALDREGPTAAALTAGEPNLLSALEAGGAALIIDGETILLGTTPGARDCARLAEWLAKRHAPLLATHRLADLVPAAADLRPVVCGLLSARLTGTDRVMWFRSEAVTEVHWAGDPHKAVTVRTSPNASRSSPPWARPRSPPSVPTPRNRCSWPI